MKIIHKVIILAMVGLSALVLLLVAGAMVGGGAYATPIALEGAGFYWSVPESTFGTAASGSADVLGIEGGWAGGAYHGGGSGVTNASAGYALFGASAVGLTTLGWMMSYSAPSLAAGETASVYVDWSASLLASYATIFGASASGGIEFELYLFFPEPPLPFHLGTYFDGTYWVGPVGYWYYGYGDTTTIENTTAIGTLQEGERWMLLATFQVASSVETLPLVGFVAEAFDIGFIDFTLRADNGVMPVPSVPEPATMLLLGSGLLGLWGARKKFKK